MAKKGLKARVTKHVEIKVTSIFSGKRNQQSCFYYFCCLRFATSATPLLELVTFFLSYFPEGLLRSDISNDKRYLVEGFYI